MKINFWPPRKRLAVYVAALGALVGFVVWCTTMPGHSFDGTAGAADERTVAALKRHVEMLATTIGPRHLDGRTEQLDAARDYLKAELERYGYTVKVQPVTVRDEHGDNLEATRAGDSADSFVVGAHYDSVALDDPSQDCPGADDNASGVAVTLALAEHFAAQHPKRTLRFVLFTNEEPPYFWRETMGSLHYARSLQDDHVKVVGMWSLETLGYYRDEPKTQHYPAIARWLYPDRGNFLGFVGNRASRSLVTTSVARFRAHADVPSEGAAMPELVEGVGWSDHWAFWQTGVPALMLTDTAPFRNPHYHQPTDTADTLDYGRLARVTTALAATLADVAALE